MIKEFAFWSAIVEKEGLPAARVFLTQLKEFQEITSEKYKAVKLYLDAMKLITQLESEESDLVLSILTGYIQKPKIAKKSIEKFLKLREEEIKNYKQYFYEVSKN